MAGRSLCPQPNCDVLRNAIQLDESEGYLPPSFDLTREFTSNPDIAGIGVLIAFVTVAYMTWITVFVYYLFGCPNRESDSEDAALSIDRSLLKWIWKKVFRRSRVPKLPPAVVNTLEEGILAFSDLQLVTSLSLLIAGFSQLRCSINTYDWQLLTYTAWFASVTHLTTLTAIRTFFRHHHNTISVIRMGLMLVVLTLLCAALLPTFHPLWLTNQFLSVAVPAVCYFEELGTTKRLSMTDTIGSSSIVSVSVSICILVVSYTARVVQIYRPLHVWTKRVLRQCPGNFLKRLILQMHSKWLEPIRFLLAAQLVLGRAIYDLVSSLFWEVQWLCYSLLWGSLHLWGIWYNGPTQEQRYWSFSQIMSLLLLALPVLSLSEKALVFAFEEKNGHHDSRRSSHSSGAGASEDIRDDVFAQPRYQYPWHLVFFVNVIILFLVAYFLAFANRYEGSIWADLAMEWCPWVDDLGLIIFLELHTLVTYGCQLWQLQDTSSDAVRRSSAAVLTMSFAICSGAAAYSLVAPIVGGPWIVP